MKTQRSKMPVVRRPLRKRLLSAMLVSAVCAILCATYAGAQSYTPRYVWVTFYSDTNGNIVAAESWGDCPIGGWGQPTGNSQTLVYNCDGELPY